MSVQPPVQNPNNAQRRAMILAQVEAKLKELWPDEKPSGQQRTFADIDALEAIATRNGDTLSRALMEEGLREALNLSGRDRPTHCEKCGRKLQWSRRKHGLQTIRGPVTIERDYAYCRACECGFFPLGGDLSAGRTPAERATTAGAMRTGQRR